MAEHLLQRAQIASSREQVGGEGVAQGVWAHLLLEPRAACVTLDDLVETLTREARAAVVQEQPTTGSAGGAPAYAGGAPASGRVGLDSRSVHTGGEKERTPALAVRAQRRHRLTADRHEPLLGALPPCTYHPLLQVDI